MKRILAMIMAVMMLAGGCARSDSASDTEITEAVEQTSSVSASETETTADSVSETETEAETVTEAASVTTAEETTAAVTSEAVTETVQTTAQTTEQTKAETTVDTTAVTTVQTTAETTTQVTTQTTAQTTSQSVAQTTAAPSVELTGEGFTNKTTMEIVRDMGIGINLGNTYESCGDWIAQWGNGTVESYETAWGSPVITEKMIKGYADEGFGVLRVPVAWSNLMDAEYNISKDYLSAVKEVVDWAIKYDMYVIVNLHYDGGWLEKFPTDKENCMKKYASIWTQVCKEFGSYGEKLMFESQNEELGWSSIWNPYGGTKGKADSYALVNEVNQKFVDVVRSSGGNNDKRHLLISGYNTNIDHTADSLFKMPSDPAGRCAVSVHYYTPPGFAILTEDADWGKAVSTWGTESDLALLEKDMLKLKTSFIDKGIPVIVGEYGCPTKNKDPESVRLFLSSVCREAYEQGACPVLWSVTGEHYDRNACKLYDRKLAELFDEITE